MMRFAHSGESHDTNGMQEMMRNMMGDGTMMFMGIVWLVIGLLLFGLAALGIIALLRYLSKSTGNAAKATLKDRYAKGEINREEYMQIKKDLGEKK